MTDETTRQGQATPETGRLSGYAERYGLVRPAHGRHIAGVCGALARATRTDPVLWRVLLPVLACFGGVGVLVYLAVWMLTREEGDTASPLEALVGRGHSSTSPVVVVLLGMLAAAMLLFVVPEPMYMLLLTGAVLLAVALVLDRARDRGTGQAGAAAPPGSGPPQGPVPPAGAQGPVPPAGAGADQAPTTPPAAGTAAAGATREDAVTARVPDPSDAREGGAAAADAPTSATATPGQAATPGDTAATTRTPAPGGTGASGAVATPVSGEDGDRSGDEGGRTREEDPAAVGAPLTGPLPGWSGPPTPPGGYRPPFAPHGPFAPAGQFAPSGQFAPAGPLPPHPPFGPPARTPPVAARRPKRERSPLTAITFFAALIVLGILGAFDMSEIADVPAAGYVAAALATVGIGLTVGTWLGRGRSLIALGLVLSLVALPATAAIERFEPPQNVATDTTWTPATVAELRDEYEVAIGRGTVDLRDVDFPPGETEITLRITGGEMQVYVPPDVNVEASLDARAGDARLFGEHAGGNVSRATFAGTEGADGPTLRLRLVVRFGHMEVSR